MIWVGLQKLSNRIEDSPVLYHNVTELGGDKVKWVKIDHCVLDVMRSSYIQDYTDNKIEEIIVPIVLHNNKSKINYYLLSTDTSFVNSFNQMLEISNKINACQTNIKISQNDPEYLGFQKTTIEAQTNKLNDLQNELEVFVNSYPLIDKTVQGFLLSEDQKRDLGYQKEDIVIKHNGLPPSAFYTWFLLIVGSLFLLICILSFIGLFSSKIEVN